MVIQIKSSLWNAKRDESVENQKVSCNIENIGFAIKYVLHCAVLCYLLV